MTFIQKALNKLGPDGKASKTPPSRSFKVDKNIDFYKDLEPGDIILYRFGGKKDFTGGVICEMTSSPYSHSAIHITDAYEIGAGSHGVSFVDAYNNNVNGRHAVIGGAHFSGMDIFRLKGGLSREQRLIIQAKLMQALLLPYDYLNLFGFPFMKNRSAVKRAGNDAYICSELTAWAYKNAGIDIVKGKPESIEAPCDVALSDVIDYIGTYVRGKKLEGDHRNKFLDEEYSVLSKLVSNFMGLFSRKDEFYAGIALNKEPLDGEA